MISHTQRGWIAIWALACMLGLFTSCEDDEDGDSFTPPDFTPSQDSSFEVPGSYNFENVETNAGNYRTALQQITNLVAAISEIERNPSDSVTLDELLAFYREGSPSLAGLTTPYYHQKLTDPNNGIFKVLADSSRSDTIFIEGVRSGVHSGDSSDFFLSDGSEPLQLIEKGLFSAALYHQAALLLSTRVLSTTDFDRAFVLFGAPADFPNDEGQEDAYGANYVSDRDNDGADFYTQIRDGFLTGRAAVAAGANDQARQAAQTIVENWEKGLAATIIHYCGGAQQLFQNGARQDGFHAYAEAYAFLDGLHGSSGIITDEEVEDLVAQLKTPTTVLENEEGQTEANLTIVINRLAQIYGFSDPTIFY